MTLKGYLTKHFTLILSGVFLFVLSVIFMGDSWLIKQQPANMDGVVHMVNGAVFHAALRNGDFPVRWTDTFANYGLPMGSFAQQFTTYLIALLTFITNDVVVSYTFTLFLGAFLSLFFFYLFLRNYFSNSAALAGAALFNFTNYRIINGHIRGALPEFFSAVFVSLLLLGLYELVGKTRTRGFFITSLAIWGLVMTHPMNVITSFVVIVPYVFWLIWNSYQTGGSKLTQKKIICLAGSIILALMLSAYYVLPLTREIRYFYYGLSSNHLNPNQFLSLKDFYQERWQYYDVATDNILSRAHSITFGVLESLLLMAGFIELVVRTIRKRKLIVDLFFVSLITAVLCIFLLSKYSLVLYEHFDLLSNIQFPWRMLSSLLFVPPILLAYFVDKLKLTSLLLIIVVSILLLRGSQLYGKNYTNFTSKYYYKTIDNLHTANMNTIWTAETTSYPVSTDKVSIIDGSGSISALNTRNSSRTFAVNAETPLRMLDRTFYFPGWKVLVDGSAVPIEFQDVEYRGVITYKVPSGVHQVKLIFTTTMTVLLANTTSLIGWMALSVLTLMEIRWHCLRKYLV